MHRLELLRKLGDGSAVEAWLGRDGPHHYLVQVSRPELEQDALAGAFRDAAARAVAATHPELLSPREVVHARDGRTVLYSDAITGWTAADLLRRGGGQPEGLVLEWGIAVCEALAGLHARGRTHGCLAPRHLHVSGDASCPAVRLADTTLLHFRAQRSVAPRAAPLVVEPEYLSPERAAGQRGTVASDVWGVGTLVVELLTGRAPFRGRSTHESRELARRARPPRPAPAFARWKRLLDGCLAPGPLDRLASALEVRQELLALV